jgi:hypothetical protein
MNRELQFTHRENRTELNRDNGYAEGGGKRYCAGRRDRPVSYPARNLPSTLEIDGNIK